MRKKVLMVFLMFLIFCTSFIVAVEDTTEESVSEKGYACLENEVEGNCDSLSSEEKIFSLLTIDRCKTEVINDKNSEACWPKDACKLKTTAQAILALNSVGTNTDDAENWLLAQQISPPDVDWLLQIDPVNAASCTITDSYGPHEILIDEAKEINRDAGTCLRKYNDYWLKVSPSCYNEEFEISCDKTFSTSLMYKKIDSGVLYISKNLQTASTDAHLTEKINSFCFKQGAGCNYEGSLWATMVLKLMGQDVSANLPYLITMTEENPEVIPESFLYSLTNNFKEELLAKQKENQYWYESGDKFYDTAVALYPLHDDVSQQKTNAIAWLEEIQGSDGCWSSIKNTAFILFSVWPKKSLIVNDSDTDCKDNGNYCMSKAACGEAGGNELVDSSGCFNNICCDRDELLESCAILGGEKCDSDEICPEGFTDSADSGRCCVSRECTEEAEDENLECEISGGECKTTCSSNEKINGIDCDGFDVCCVEKSGNYTWLLILGILIILTTIGIIFRDKLRGFWFKIKSKFKKGGPSRPTGPPGFPPGPSSAVPQGRSTPRRIFPPNQRPVRKSAPVHKDLDNVLKKLKEMGK